ncbi:MAG: hypothetical protein CMH64_00815 [Nanoarchaeota archaeon]|nr:hypothetical protein [Nanoarchaeota archaeon]|tara:strand:- start:497 stop:1039 length:543 start_codon:yes stop_codon:yes gene_type:complete
MKITIISLFIVLLLATTIDAKSITEDLSPGESVILKNQNISLLKLDKKEDKVIMCINGQKTIVTEDKIKTVNNVIINVKSVKDSYAEIKLESSCDNCIPSNNNACLNECTSNSNCNDNNENTKDICAGIPLRCYHEEIEKPKVEVKNPEPTEIDITVNVPQAPKTFFEKLKDLFFDFFFE